MRLAKILVRLLGVTGLALALGGAAPMDKKPVIGEPAPDAEFTMLAGSKVQLSALRGQVVVINFWASWCVPCRTELPLLDTYYKLQKKHGLRVIAATTQSSASYGQMRKLIALLTIEPAKKVKGPYAPIKGAVPTNYIVDRNGTVRYAKSGAFSLATLNEQLVPLLREREPPSLPAPAVPTGER